MEAARKVLAAGAWQEAIAGYLGLIAAYPAADQAPEAVKGIDGARAGMLKDAEQKAAADARTIADLRKSNDGNLARSEALQRDLEKARSETAKAAAAGGSTSAAASSAAQAGDIAASRKKSRGCNR